MKHRSDLSTRAGRHRRPRPAKAPLYRRPGTLTATALGALLVAGGVAQAVAHSSSLPSPQAAIDHAGAGAGAGSASSTDAGAGAGQVRRVESVPTRSAGTATRDSSPGASPSPTSTPTLTPTTVGYANPLRAISGLIAERIDMGVDFGGTGPVYALGDAVITHATADSAGWPGGGWITYRLTSGPAEGLVVYLAEDVTPEVQVGQQVTASTVIATMYNGGAGIETGWAMADGSSAESQLPEAGGISGGGPFPSMVGLNFEELLQSLGGPAAEQS